jgi:hypothetical protein
MGESSDDCGAPNRAVPLQASDAGRSSLLNGRTIAEGKGRRFRFIEGMFGEELVESLGEKVLPFQIA